MNLLQNISFRHLFIGIVVLSTFLGIVIIKPAEQYAANAFCTNNSDCECDSYCNGGWCEASYLNPDSMPDDTTSCNDAEDAIQQNASNPPVSGSFEYCSNGQDLQGQSRVWNHILYGSQGTSPSCTSIKTGAAEYCNPLDAGCDSTTCGAQCQANPDCSSGFCDDSTCTCVKSCSQANGYCDSRVQITGNCSKSGYIYESNLDATCSANYGCCIPDSSGGGSGTNPTPTPAPNGNIGWVDGGNAATCHDITGWACGPSKATVKVDLYDGPYTGSSSNFITEVTANSSTSDSTQPDCNSNQGFDFPSSSLPQDNKQHSYYVYINGDGNALTNSPESATCTNVCQGHPNNFTVNKFCNGAESDATFSWNAVNGATQYTFQFSDNGSATTTRTTTNNSFTVNRFPQGAAVSADVYTSQPCTSPKNRIATTALVCAYAISGTIYKDYNHNGVKDGADSVLSGVTVTLDDTTTNTTVGTTTTDASGAYSFTGVAKGDNYHVTATAPAGGYKVNTTNPATVTNLSQNATVNFGVTPLYTISGTIFNDLNLDQKYESGTESAYTTTASTIKITGPVNTTVNTSTGSYTSPQTLTAGTYTVSDTTTLPTGYRFTTPSSWSVTVGDPAGGSPTCSPGASPYANCTNPNNGSIATLNFGVSNENVWSQFCSDARFNAGYSQPIPSTANCGGTSAAYALYCPTNTNPGVLFSGSTDPNYGAGIGASINNLEVGNSLFPENFTPRIPNTISSSYSFVSTTLNNASPAPTPLTSICPNLTNCVLSENTLGGVYTATAADGPVSISVSNADGTFQLGKASYTFVIGGNLTFTSNVLMQNGYSASFISGGDIHVASNVGESDWTSLTPDLEGLFSTDGNFSIDAAYASGQQCTASGQPKELKLNIVGSVIANAANKGGSFVNNREGCLQDLQCPATTVTANPLLILHAPGALKPPYSFWQELNP